MKDDELIERVHVIISPPEVCEYIGKDGRPFQKVRIRLNGGVTLMVSNSVASRCSSKMSTWKTGDQIKATYHPYVMHNKLIRGNAVHIEWLGAGKANLRVGTDGGVDPIVLENLVLFLTNAICCHIEGKNIFDDKDQLKEINRIMRDALNIKCLTASFLADIKAMLKASNEIRIDNTLREGMLTI